MSDILERIEAYLSSRQTPAAPAAPALTAAAAATLDEVRHALSGAFGEAIDVIPGAGDEAEAIFALVPVRHLAASGLKMVETVCPPRVGDRSPGSILRVLIGSPAAARNAANRVAKPLGEGWKVQLDSFPAGTTDPEGVAYFRLDRVS